ncbi:transposase [candidate division LCP-89 bacterium B3_LCP]|uniref:Transposase n=1 Tax=candidate division LCP-89 bacterium B3_LCP TaxID=2012998 RepID=A0A532V4S5_UNCL8|nr:MAG: transposase [candidate division LCP-89 bacterium B3_LCP]
MPHNVYSKIYLHFTWHTKNNEPILKSEVLKALNTFVRSKCEKTKEVLFISFGGIENHVHLAVKVPPSLNIAQWIGEIKGFSSHEIKGSFSLNNFSWQEGYGVVSFSERDLDTIVEYIENQPKYHKANKLFTSLENAG